MGDFSGWVTNMSFLQCSDTVGWLTRGTCHLHRASLMLKPFLSENFLIPANSGPKIVVLDTKGGLRVNYCYCDPKKTSLHRTASFDVFCIKIGAAILAVGEMRNPQNSRVIFGPDMHL